MSEKGYEILVRADAKVTIVVGGGLRYAAACALSEPRRTDLERRTRDQMTCDTIAQVVTCHEVSVLPAHVEFGQSSHVQRIASIGMPPLLLLSPRLHGPQSASAASWLPCLLQRIS